MKRRSEIAASFLYLAPACPVKTLFCQEKFLLRLLCEMALSHLAYCFDGYTGFPGSRVNPGAGNGVVTTPRSTSDSAARELCRVKIQAPDAI